MSILEKLGITPGPWEVINGKMIEIISTEQRNDDGDYALVAGAISYKENANIIAAAPEMLEALISVQRYIGGDKWEDIDISKVIEKATGKTWKEVKELL